LPVFTSFGGIINKPTSKPARRQLTPVRQQAVPIGVRRTEGVDDLPDWMTSGQRGRGSSNGDALEADSHALEQILAA
jgi:hypothetical protein